MHISQVSASMAVTVSSNDNQHITNTHIAIGVKMLIHEITITFTSYAGDKVLKCWTF